MPNVLHLPRTGARDRDDIARRMDKVGTLIGQEGNAELIPDLWQPRWRIDGKWIEFECGCRAERVRSLHQPEPWDPIIFPGTAQQAVYDSVCHRHAPGMNKRCHFGGFVDFEQWRKARRAVLMGRVRA